jgi:hypothetical protein
LKISTYTILWNIYLKLNNYLSIFHTQKTDITKFTRKLSKTNRHFCIKFCRIKLGISRTPLLTSISSNWTSSNIILYRTTLWHSYLRIRYHWDCISWIGLIGYGCDWLRSDVISISCIICSATRWCKCRGISWSLCSLCLFYTQSSWIICRRSRS